MDRRRLEFNRERLFGSSERNTSFNKNDLRNKILYNNPDDIEIIRFPKSNRRENNLHGHPNSFLKNREFSRGLNTQEASNSFYNENIGYDYNNDGCLDQNVKKYSNDRRFINEIVRYPRQNEYYNENCNNYNKGNFSGSHENNLTDISNRNNNYENITEEFENIHNFSNKLPQIERPDRDNYRGNTRGRNSATWYFGNDSSEDDKRKASRAHRFDIDNNFGNHSDAFSKNSIFDKFENRRRSFDVGKRGINLADSYGNDFERDPKQNQGNPNRGSFDGRKMRNNLEEPYHEVGRGPENYHENPDRVNYERRRRSFDGRKRKISLEESYHNEFERNPENYQEIPNRFVDFENRGSYERRPKRRKLEEQDGNEIEDSFKEYHDEVIRMSKKSSSDGTVRKKFDKSNIVYEKDPNRLRVRQRQIDIGKETDGYKNYVADVERKDRTKDHPWTPDKEIARSTRSWQGLLRVWRRKLHYWDV